MDDWQPATIEEVNEMVARDLTACDAEQLAATNIALSRFQRPWFDTDRRTAWLSSHETVIRSSTGKMWKMGSTFHPLVLMAGSLNIGAMMPNCGLR
jgi:hypothetical protein